MIIIAAITRDHALGKNGDMLYHISPDLKRFKALTMGHALIMGRKTFESFPKGPLPGRRNLVVTRNAEYTHPGIETFRSLEEAIAAAGDEPYVIGGGQIYAQAMPLCDRLAITELDVEGVDADTHFPAIDPQEWRQVDASPWQIDERTGIRYRFVDYERK